jgi:methylase of polypeptide subunit release factors
VIEPLSATDAADLRAQIAAAGYTEAGIQEALNVRDPPAPQQRSEARLLYQTREPTVFNLLARWFLLGVPVRATLARETLPSRLLQLLAAAGLLADRSDTLEPTALLAPYQGLLIASDTFQQLASPSGSDHVLVVNPAARHFANFALRERVGSTLDLCGGSGVQGLLAAADSESVVSTDLNPRATRYAAFNARLNGIEHLRCLTGDAFAPVAGERFDRILCNPPFVLAPAREYVYRDNDLPLDEFCRRLAREAPAHLTEGGCFQMIAEWVSLDGAPWQARVAEWVEGSGCDAWVLKDYTQSPALYALTRLRETLPTSPEADRATYAHWMDYYRAERVTAIHGGLIALRRRAGRTWTCLEELPATPAEPFGEAIRRGFLARHFLATHAEDESLLGARLALTPDAVLRREHRREGGAWVRQPVRLVQTAGLLRQVPMDPAVASFLSDFDGSRPVRDHIEALAASVEAARDQVETETLRVVRRMVETGFLLPA